MGLAMHVAQFADGTRPTLEQVVARAQDIGGLSLQFDGWEVRFVDVPDIAIAIHHTSHLPMGPGRSVVDAVGLSDHSGVSLPLMTLLSHALIDLGATMDPPPGPLPLPLTAAYLQRERRKAHLYSLGGCLFVSLLLLLGAAGVLALAWGAWRGMQALFA